MSGACSAHQRCTKPSLATSGGGISSTMSCWTMRTAWTAWTQQSSLPSALLVLHKSSSQAGMMWPGKASGSAMLQALQHMRCLVALYSSRPKMHQCARHLVWAEYVYVSCNWHSPTPDMLTCFAANMPLAPSWLAPPLHKCDSGLLRVPGLAKSVVLVGNPLQKHPWATPCRSLRIFCCRSVEVYSHAQDKWSQGTAMPSKESFAGCAMLADKIALVGGGLHGSTLSLYSPASQTWSTADAPSTPHQHSAVAAIQDSLFVLVRLASSGLQACLVCQAFADGMCCCPACILLMLPMSLDGNDKHDKLVTRQMRVPLIDMLLLCMLKTCQWQQQYMCRVAEQAVG